MISTSSCPAPGGVLHPRGGVSEGALRVAEPRHPHRRRPGPRHREPRAALPRNSGSRTGGGVGLAGARHRAARVGASPTRRLRAGPSCPRSTGTSRPRGVALLVLVADCLPVALAPRAASAMLHCGWRGLAGGIVEGAGRVRRRAGGRGDRARHRALLLRGRRRGARTRSPDLDGVARADARPEGRRSAQARGRRSHADPRRRPVHLLRARPVLLAPPRQRGHRAPRRDGRRAWRSSPSRPARVAENLEGVRERIAAAGRDPERSRSAPRSSTWRSTSWARWPRAASAVGENRAQELVAKQERCGDAFTWDFIGALQSRKAKDVAPIVRLIHSVASESALAQLEANPRARC